ncbi:uncharacterized protein LOC119921704 [Tachyglossus aculeatus]|uniref:uncharacterized protein LOC119921704 n=1 Tax=Tachyglossus aculeatus TaxID=9261 RepID=UPI0018F372C9|nr:uncharacterized protein LOC119921704 [Tachyglossus aculeatus]
MEFIVQYLASHLPLLPLLEIRKVHASSHLALAAQGVWRFHGRCLAPIAPIQLCTERPSQEGMASLSLGGVLSTGIQKKRKLGPGPSPGLERDRAHSLPVRPSCDEDVTQATKRRCVQISLLAAGGKSLVNPSSKKTGSTPSIRIPVPFQVLLDGEAITVNELEMAFQRFFGSQHSGLEVPTLNWMDGSILKSDRETNYCLSTLAAQARARSNPLTNSEDFCLKPVVSSPRTTSSHKLQLPRIPRRASVRPRSRRRLRWDS